MRCDAMRKGVSAKRSAVKKTKQNAQTHHERRTPRPCPPRAKLHLRERTALLFPRVPESPRRDTNGEPSNLFASVRRKKKQQQHVNTKRRTWLDTPTRFCSHAHSWPFSMKVLPKHSALILLVRSSAGSGTPPRVVHAKMGGACDAVARP